jgi:uncharacterized membrane protein
MDKNLKRIIELVTILYQFVGIYANAGVTATLISFFPFIIGVLIYQSITDFDDVLIWFSMIGYNVCNHGLTSFYPLLNLIWKEFSTKDKTIPELIGIVVCFFAFMLPGLIAHWTINKVDDWFLCTVFVGWATCTIAVDIYKLLEKK